MLSLHKIPLKRSVFGGKNPTIWFKHDFKIECKIAHQKEILKSPSKSSSVVTLYLSLLWPEYLCFQNQTISWNVNQIAHLNTSFHYFLERCLNELNYLFWGYYTAEKLAALNDISGKSDMHLWPKRNHFTREIVLIFIFLDFYGDEFLFVIGWNYHEDQSYTWNWVSVPK